MKKISQILFGVVVVVVLAGASLLSLGTAEVIEEPVEVAKLITTPQQAKVLKAPQPDINEVPLADNMALYADDDPGSIVTMYVTVRKGNPSDNTDHTWEEVNDATKFFFDSMENVQVDKTEIIFQVGDEKGPLPGEVGYGETVPNGTIQVRGNSASRQSLKSYKIVLHDRTGSWRGQYTIALNKHIADPSRIKNKLCFDLLQDIPNLVSLQTQFVNLYVKDETSDPPSEAFVDYGLFTQVEQPNRTFLRSHGLDPNGHLYKPTFFEFFRYPDEIRLVDDPQYNLTNFEKRLEIKGNRNHAKLIQMLEDINNPLIPMEESFERYFDAENYFTWLAFNILVGSTDTAAQNFYIYSPQNGERWYFMSWDYDDSLSRLSKEVFSEFDFQNWEKGIQTYWGVVLHNRILMVEKYRKALDEKIEEVYALLNHENIENKLAIYRSATEPFMNRMPDQYFAEPDEYEMAYRNITDEIDNNYLLYKQSLKEPMPFFLGIPEIIDNQMIFMWGNSYDFQAEDITYHVQVSRDFNFEDLVLEAKTENIPRVISESILLPGTYFWRVIAENKSGFSQYPFDRYIDVEGLPHNGMRSFNITVDGKILSQ